MNSLNALTLRTQIKLNGLVNNLLNKKGEYFITDRGSQYAIECILINRGFERTFYENHHLAIDGKTRIKLTDGNKSVTIVADEWNVSVRCNDVPA